MNTYELMILDWIQNNIRTDFLDWLMPLITSLGNSGIIWIAMTIVLLLIPKTRKYGVIMGISLVIESLCCDILLKPLIARTRPFDVNGAVQLLISRPKDFSFPSGHTGASFAAVSALYFSKNRLWIPCGILAALIAVSRLYLYVHYPTDVLTGVLLGIIAGWLGSVIVRAFRTKKSNPIQSNT